MYYYSNYIIIIKDVSSVFGRRLQWKDTSHHHRALIVHRSSGHPERSFFVICSRHRPYSSSHQITASNRPLVFYASNVDK